MARGNEPLGDIATKVLFENEKVKVWNLVVDPGEASGWHLHPRDYVTVVVAGGGLTVEYDDGTSGVGSAAVGTWTYHSEPRVHRVVNYTDTTYKNVLIQPKS